MNSDLKKISVLVSLASALQIAESMIPHPIPGIRLGLANIITLVTMKDLGIKQALEVAVLRTIVSSFVLGNFLSPSFILSFSSAVTSTLVMCFFYQISTHNSQLYLSIIGISLLGAVTHSATQIVITYLLFIKHKGIFYLVPYLGLSAVITGWINGLLAINICRNIDNSKIEKKCDRLELIEFTNTMVKSDSKTIIKLSIAVVTILLILFLQKFWLYLITFFLILIISLRLKVSFIKLFRIIRFSFWFLIFSFLIPVIFNSYGKIFFDLKLFKITYEGLILGGMFVFRIVLMMLIVSLLTLTTSVKDITAGLNYLFRWLKLFKIPVERISLVIIYSLPTSRIILRRIKLFFASQKFINLKQYIMSVNNFIVSLYLQV